MRIFLFCLFCFFVLVVFFSPRPVAEERPQKDRFTQTCNFLPPFLSLSYLFSAPLSPFPLRPSFLFPACKGNDFLRKRKRKQRNKRASSGFRLPTLPFGAKLSEIKTESTSHCFEPFVPPGAVGSVKLRVSLALPSPKKTTK